MCFDLKRFDNEEYVRKNLKCDLCLNALCCSEGAQNRQEKKESNDGITVLGQYCERCVYLWFKDKSSFPNFHKELNLTNLQPLDENLHSQLKEQNISCKYRYGSAGCQFVGKLESIENHESRCLYAFSTDCNNVSFTMFMQIVEDMRNQIVSLKNSIFDLNDKLLTKNMEINQLRSDFLDLKCKQSTLLECREASDQKQNLPKIFEAHGSNDPQDQPHTSNNNQNECNQVNKTSNGASIHSSCSDIYDNESSSIESVNSQATSEHYPKKKKIEVQEVDSVHANKKIRQESTESECQDWRKDCKELLKQIMDNPNSIPFRFPVPLDEFPDYKDFVQEPMDFGTIQKKLTENVYNSLKDFENDCKLVISNSKSYNTITKAKIYEMTQCLENFFHTEFMKISNKYDPEINKFIVTKSGRKGPRLIIHD